MEAPDWQGVIAIFIKDSAPEEIARVAEDVERVARAGLTESELQKVLVDELGCYYTPCPDLDGPSFHEWLFRVSSELRVSMAQPSLQADRPLRRPSA